MRYILGCLVKALFFVTLFITPTVSNPEGAKGEDAVVSLNIDNFKKKLSQSDYFIVEFFSLKCPHCREFAPVYEDLGAQIDKEFPNVGVGKVDVDIENQLAHEYHITRIPKLMFFTRQNPEPIIFQGDRTTEALLSWIQQEVDSLQNGLFLQLSHKKIF